MNRHVYSRLMLSCVLVWQLGAGEVVRASPASGSSTVHTHASHCPTQDQSHTESGRQGSVPSHSNSLHDAPAGSTDCCTNSTCTCDCAGTAALSVTLFDRVRIVPDHPAVIDFAAPFVDARVFEFFRPPI